MQVGFSLDPTSLLTHRPPSLSPRARISDHRESQSHKFIHDLLVYSARPAPTPAGASLVAQTVKNLPAMQETRV